MKYYKTIIIGISLFICNISLTHGQASEEELGILYLNSLKSTDLSAIENLIPNEEILIQYSESIGIRKTKIEFDELKKMYGNEVERFLSRYIELRNYGESIGIDWSLVEFIETEINSREITIIEKESPVEVTNINVIFSFNDDTYRLRIDSIFEIDNRWYLAGDNPIIEYY